MSFLMNWGVKKMSTVLIVGGGPVDLGQLQAELATAPELIIAADGGGAYLAKLQSDPDLLIGDLDSLAPEIVNDFRMRGIEIHTFPTNKDQTDLQLALEFAYSRGLKEIRILGALGGRLDHTLGNLGLLMEALRQEAKVWLLDPQTEITLIGAELELIPRAGWGLSLIPFTQNVKVITTIGLKYPLINETLLVVNTKGIHNEFVALDQKAKIIVKEGFLLVVLFQEN